MKILIAFIILLASCSSSRKALTSSLQELDSNTVKKSDTAVLSKTDSTSVKKDNSQFTSTSDSDYEKRTEEEEIEGTVGSKDTSKKYIAVDPADYFPAGTKVKITKRTTYEKGKTKTETKAQVNRSDSTSTKRVDSIAGHKSDSSSLRKKTENRSKDVKGTRFLPGLMWILLLLVLLWIGYRYYLWKKKGIGFFSWLIKKSIHHDKENHLSG